MSTAPRAIADALGWYASERMQVVSRYPIIDPPGANGIYVWIEVAPGRIVAIGNVHLPSDPYGPYAIRDGASLADVLALERSTRLPALADQLAVLPGLAARRDPRVPHRRLQLTFAPRLDTGRRLRCAPTCPSRSTGPSAGRSPTSGFRDSYRVVHPDPVAVPGFTWTPGGPESDPREVHDRIDWVLAAGPATAIASGVVGEVGGPDVVYSVAPWPTDHRGVVSTFRVTPAVPPPFAAVDSRRVVVGDVLGVRYHAAPERGSGSRSSGRRAASAAVAATAGRYARVRSTGGSTFAHRSPRAGCLRGDPVVAAGSVSPREPVLALPAGGSDRVATSKSTYLVGEPIDVTW